VDERVQLGGEGNVAGLVRGHAEELTVTDRLSKTAILLWSALKVCTAYIVPTTEAEL
jgi:hypothetical protein